MVKYFGVLNRSILVMIFDDFCQKQGSFTFNAGSSWHYGEPPRIARCEGFTPENDDSGTDCQNYDRFGYHLGKRKSTLFSEIPER